MMNVMEIEGHRAIIQYDPERDRLYGQFIGLEGKRGGDFYAKDVTRLRRAGIVTLRNLIISQNHSQTELAPLFLSPPLTLHQISQSIAATLEGTQLYEHAQIVAAIEERQRLAQSLHDAVNQSLFSASMIAEVLPRLWDRNQAEGRQALEDLRYLIRGALAEMRGLLAELRPVVLSDTDLGDLLHQLGDALTGRTNVPVAVEVLGKDFLPTEIRLVFYRLCQEVLNNIAKHAHATAVSIRLKYESNTAELRIRDNGRGFDPENIPPKHYGLSMMRERAKAIGATLTIHSQPHEGTEILIYWVESDPAREDSA